MIKSKKAAGTWTSSEMLKLILAGISLLILIYLGTQVYSLMATKTKTQQAKETLEDIVSIAESLEDGESREYLLQVPNEWVLMDVDKKLCICPAPSLSSNTIPKRETVEQACIEEGICGAVDREVEISSSCSWSKWLNSGLSSCFEIEITTLQISKTSESLDLIPQYSKTKNTIIQILEFPVEINEETKIFEDLIFMFDDRQVENNLFLEKAKLVLDNFCETGYVFEVSLSSGGGKIVGFEKDSIVVNVGLGPTVSETRLGNYQSPVEFEFSRKDIAYLVKYYPHKGC